MGNGPRGTPAVDSGLVFALGGSGDLVCVDANSGQQRWQKNILSEFDGRNIGWGISESPLVDGDKVIVTPGGRAATMAALDKTDGTVIWRSQVPGDHSAGYSSAIVATVNGVRQYINFTNKAVIGVDANSGRPLWSDNSSSNNTANCSSPLFYQNHVFSASGYNKGGAMLFLQSRNGRTISRFVYETDKMKNHHGGMVIVDGYIYGSSDPGILTCLELRSGRVAWQTRDVSKGSVTYADGHLYVRAESGPMYLVEATPQGHEVKGRFNQPQRSGKKAWSHPVVAEGKLFLRDQDMLFCYDIKN
jgi:outer membrane protein assembly factor BamB